MAFTFLADNSIVGAILDCSTCALGWTDMDLPLWLRLENFLFNTTPEAILLLFDWETTERAAGGANTWTEVVVSDRSVAAKETDGWCPGAEDAWFNGAENGCWGVAWGGEAEDAWFVGAENGCWGVAGGGEAEDAWFNGVVYCFFFLSSMPIYYWGYY